MLVCADSQRTFCSVSSLQTKSMSVAELARAAPPVGVGLGSPAADPVPVPNAVDRPDDIRDPRPASAAMARRKKLTNEQWNQLESLKRMSHWLDEMWSITIPVLGTFRFGLDPILGLIPGFGDAFAAIVSLSGVLFAVHIGVGLYSLGQMIFNILVDQFVGSIPLVGDWFDVSFKANKLNLAIIERHISGETSPALPSWMEFLYGVLIAVCVILILGFVWIWFKIWVWCLGVWYAWFAVPFIRFVFGISDTKQ